MSAKPLAGIAAMAVRRAACVAAASVALFVVAACKDELTGGGSGGSGSASTKTVSVNNKKSPAEAKAPGVYQAATAGTATATNEAAEAQVKAAEKLCVPVEKTLPRSGIVLRLIPAGTFAMGSPAGEEDRRDDETLHKVTLTNAFYLGKYEVTQGQWEKVMGDNPSKFKVVGDNAPVECVSWKGCQEFMKKLAVLEGMPEEMFRLPTEAEWEYACRAGTQTAFCYSDDLDSSMANFDGRFPYGGGGKGEVLRKTTPVGQFMPNAWGLYDMHGNVWEWCADRYGKYGGDATDPRGPASGSLRVLRGGSWYGISRYCRSAGRRSDAPGSVLNTYGFRLCMPTSP